MAGAKEADAGARLTPAKLASASLTGARWTITSTPPRVVAGLAAQLGLGRLTARTLAARGFRDPAEARRFLDCDLAGLHDPFLMQDMVAAVDLLEQALARGAHIRIYGDYDADGVCATALLVRALGGLGAKADWYIPHRVDEGYGLNEEAIKQAAAEGVELLITADCGTNAAGELALARELGLQVIVTDHHRVEAQPSSPVPQTHVHPVLNPCRPDCGYPFKDLAGVGVAFKLVSALARRHGLPEGAELRFLDLVCLGTVADVVPLLGENRLLVHHGLRQLGESRKVGLTALLEAAEIRGEVGSRHVAFGLAPRINAMGRMEHAQAAVQLLLTGDAAQARDLAARLSQQNDRRRDEEQRILQEAEQRVAEEVDLARERVIVLASDTWHPGVIGIVASRLVERHHRPVLLVALAGDEGKGSGRSIPAFNLWAGLRECAALLTRFGGHHYAAGFGIAAHDIPALRERINEVAAASLSPEDLVRTLIADGEAHLADLSAESVRELAKMAPLGMGNPAPLFVTRGLVVEDARMIGDGSHLSLRLRQQDGSAGAAVQAVWFRRGQLLDRLLGGTPVEVCYRPQLDEWNDSVRVRLVVEDVAVGAA
jgi:single-stranded-DNA-specific exonuclease